METEKIMELINKGLQDNDFSGPAERSKMSFIERTLRVTLPGSYQWFLQRYGHGGIGGLEILGVNKSGEPVCISETERFRKLGLPQTYVVIENCDEWVSCLDTSKITGDECPIVDWDRKGNSEMVYNSFESYLCERLEAALERMGIE